MRAANSALRVLGLAAAALLLGPALALGQHVWIEEPPPPEQEGWTAVIDLPVSSKYLWRGATWVDRPVFQPSLFGTKGELTVGLWANITLDNAVVDGTPVSAGTTTEVDLCLDYALTLWGVDCSVGAAHYVYLKPDLPSTREVYLEARLPGRLSPSVTVWRDVVEVEGTYVAVSVAPEIRAGPLSRLVAGPISTSASVGFGSSEHNAYYYGVDKAGLADLTVTANLPLSASEYQRATLSLGYSVLLDGELREAVGTEGEFWYGLSFMAAF